MQEPEYIETPILLDNLPPPETQFFSDSVVEA